MYHHTLLAQEHDCRHYFTEFWQRHHQCDAFDKLQRHVRIDTVIRHTSTAPKCLDSCNLDGPSLLDIIIQEYFLCKPTNGTTTIPYYYQSKKWHRNETRRMVRQIVDQLLHCSSGNSCSCRTEETFGPSKPINTSHHHGNRACSTTSTSNSSRGGESYFTVHEHFLSRIMIVIHAAYQEYCLFQTQSNPLPVSRRRQQFGYYCVVDDSPSLNRNDECFLHYASALSRPSYWWKYHHYHDHRDHHLKPNRILPLQVDVSTLELLLHYCHSISNDVTVQTRHVVSGGLPLHYALYCDAVCSVPYLTCDTPSSTARTNQNHNDTHNHNIDTGSSTGTTNGTDETSRTGEIVDDIQHIRKATSMESHYKDWYQWICILLQQYPEACRIPDVYGYLPLHYAIFLFFSFVKDDVKDDDGNESDDCIASHRSLTSSSSSLLHVQCHERWCYAIITSLLEADPSTVDTPCKVVQQQRAFDPNRHSSPYVTQAHDCKDLTEKTSTNIDPSTGVVRSETIALYQLVALLYSTQYRSAKTETATAATTKTSLCVVDLPLTLIYSILRMSPANCTRKST
jgi:hypothetical protein